MKTDNVRRCSSPAAGYGRVLFEMDIPGEIIEETRKIFDAVPQLTDIFSNPTIALKKKLSIIDRVFPGEIRNFLKTACRYQRMNLMQEIFAAYDRLMDEKENVVNAVLICITPPSGEQMQGMEKFLCEKYGADRAQIRIWRDDSLMGGFILRVGSEEYDWSLRGRLNRLEQTLTWR